MGMESYYVDILPKNVKFYMDGDIRKIEGVSSFNLSEFVMQIQKLQLPIRLKNENIFIIDEAIQLQLILTNQNIQVITLQGCFTWFEEGIELCYNIVRFIKTNIFEVDVSVLNEDINLDNEVEFKKNVIELYNEKFEYFRKYLADFKAKILPCDFYDYRKKILKEKTSIISKVKNFFKEPSI